MCEYNINYLLASGDFCRLLMIFRKQSADDKTMKKYQACNDLISPVAHNGTFVYVSLNMKPHTLIRVILNNIFTFDLHTFLGFDFKRLNITPCIRTVAIQQAHIADST